MKLLIRADANNIIASGHIMRCMAIAQEAISQGHEIKFVVADHSSEGLLKKYDMPFICMDTEWHNMENENSVISEIVQNEQADCILVDSYYVTESYLLELKKFCKVIYIDDMNKCVYPCDILICYANYYKKFEYEKKYDKNVGLLLGPMYAPIRKVFYEAKRIEKTKQNKTILLMSGGADEYHIIQRVLVELDKVFLDGEYIIYAVCGLYNGDYEKLLEKYNNSKNVILLKNIDNIHEYMNEADIAISAGGSTLYELCACGTPTICYSFADNQIDNVKSFSDEGIMIYAGDAREDKTIVNIVKEIDKLLFNERKRKNLSRKMCSLVDGKGTKRIIREICNYLEERERK